MALHFSAPLVGPIVLAAVFLGREAVRLRLGHLGERRSALARIGRRALPDFVAHVGDLGVRLRRMLNRDLADHQFFPAGLVG